MTATFYIGDALEVMAKLPEKSVDLVMTSPPFLALRSYLPADHPDKAKEGGSQATPGEFIDWLIDIAEACDRVLAPHGSMCIELGDTYSGKSGWDSAGDDTWSAGPDRMAATGWRSRPDKPSADGWPLAKSLSLIPELFRFSLVYGFNPLTGRQTERWRLRNVVRWVRPNPPVGALGDKFRPATSELMVFCKSAKRYFDLDAVRGMEPEKPHGGWPISEKYIDAGLDSGSRKTRIHENGAPPLDWWNIPLLEGEEETRYGPGEKPKAHARTARGVESVPRAGKSAERGGNWASLPELHETLGAPPLDWWEIPPGGYEGAHYAVFPPELCVKPIKAMCPERVCRVCGEPSRRVLNDRFMWNRQPALAAHIKQRRKQAGLSLADVDAWFEFNDGAAHWERTDSSGARIPTPDVWPMLKERLSLSDEFDDMIFGGSTVDYLTENGQALALAERRVAYDRGGLPPVDASRIKANRKAPDAWSDCGHDSWRPGLVLDPFAGSGTTLAVATGHGRDAWGIDLDARNFDLALERVGPFILSKGEAA